MAVRNQLRLHWALWAALEHPELYPFIIMLAEPHISAFTVAELEEMMRGWKMPYWAGGEDGQWFSVFNDPLGKITDADARAKMVIYLVENNLIPANS